MLVFVGVHRYVEGWISQSHSENLRFFPLTRLCDQSLCTKGPIQQPWNGTNTIMSAEMNKPQGMVDGSEIRRSPVDMVKHPIIYRVSKTSQVLG